MNSCIPHQNQVSHPDNVSHASLLEILVEMNDADGIDAVLCGLNIYRENRCYLFNVRISCNRLRRHWILVEFMVAAKRIEWKSSLEIGCEDWSGNVVNYSAQILVDAPIECLVDCDKIEQETEDSSQS